MSEVIMFFLPPFVGFVLVILGFEYENYILGVLGSLALLSFGIATLIQPLSVLSSLYNDIYGSVLIGVGAYLFIVGTWQEINKNG